MMLDEPNCKKSLMRYARCHDPVMQKVIVKIIFCTLESSDLRLDKTRAISRQSIQHCTRNHSF